MAQIEIKHLSDEHDCETCGADWATGYAVTINGKPFGDFEPIAHCYAGQTFDIEQVYEALLKELGHDIRHVHGED